MLAFARLLLVTRDAVQSYDTPEYEAVVQTLQEPCDREDMEKMACWAAGYGLPGFERHFVGMLAQPTQEPRPSAPDPEPRPSAQDRSRPRPSRAPSTTSPSATASAIEYDAEELDLDLLRPRPSRAPITTSGAATVSIVEYEAAQAAVAAESCGAAVASGGDSVEPPPEPSGPSSAEDLWDIAFSDAEVVAYY